MTYTRSKLTGNETRLSLLGAAVSLALAASTGPNAAEIQPRIVGGQPAGNGAYPFMAALMEDDFQFCGGSLIAPNWVLTAAHCVENGSAAGLQVMVGSNRLDGSGQHIGAKRVIVHQDYAGGGVPDVALIELNQSAAVAPIPLLEPGTGLENTGQTATVIGWGTTSENGSATDDLMEVDIPIVDNAICARAYDGQVDSGLEICAGLPQGGKDSCQGDSGGPLFVRNGSGEYLQAGVVSWGDGCARPEKYGVYARVSSQVDWIASHTGAASGGGSPGEGGGDTGGNPGDGGGTGGDTGDTGDGTVPGGDAATANFSVACEGLSCQFDAGASSGGSAGIDAYYWDFGDYQGWDMGRRVNYRYGTAGTYEVYLTVVTGDYDVVEAVRTVTVTAPDTGTPGGGSGSGYLSGSGDYALEPSAPFELAESQVVVGTLQGPAGTDFDLYLERYKPRTGEWVTVRASESLDSEERIRFKSRRSATYQWVVNSYEGAGTYAFEMDIR